LSAPKNPAPAVTHDHLVERAGQWLKAKGCGMVFTEMVTNQTETPDAIGWRNSGQESFLIECKATRSDFLADRNKSFRRGHVAGLGRYRYYMCPPGLIKPEELPARWGLLYCHARKVVMVVGRDPQSYHLTEEFSHEANDRGEIRMFYSALSRLRIDMGVAAFHERVHLPYSVRTKEQAKKEASQTLAAQFGQQAFETFARCVTAPNRVAARDELLETL
jgi:hypothetical protein